MNLLWDIQAKTYDSAATYTREAAARHRMLRTPERRQIAAPVVKRSTVVLNEREGLQIELPRPARPLADAHVRAWWAHMTASVSGAPVRDYVRARCSQLGVPYTDVIGVCRTKAIVTARHKLIIEVRERYPHLSSVQIGRVFGKDHSSIIHCFAKAEGRIKSAWDRPARTKPNERELAVIRLYAKGHTHEEIQAILGITFNARKGRLASAYRVARVSGVANLVRWARTEGLIE